MANGSHLECDLHTKHVFAVIGPMPFIWVQISLRFVLRAAISEIDEKSEKLAYFGLSGTDLRPFEQFKPIQLHSQSMCAIRTKVAEQFLRK